MTLTATGRNMLARAKWQVRTINVLEKVFNHRIEQVERYGHNDDKPDGTGPGVRWIPGLRTGPQPGIGLPTPENTAKEIEAIFRSAYEKNGGDGGVTWMELIREEVAESFAESDPDRLEEELIQVAALCVSWVETIQKRREGKTV